MFKNTEKKNNGINPKGKIICTINHHCFKLYVILVCSFLWGFLFFLGGGSQKYKKSPKYCLFNKGSKFLNELEI